MSNKFLSLKRLKFMLERLRTTLDFNRTTIKDVTLENPTATGTVTGFGSSGIFASDVSASGDIYGSNLYINAVGQNVVQVSNTGNNLSKWEWHRDGTRKWVIYNDGRTSPSIYTDALVFKHGTAADADATHINMALSPNDQDVKFYGHITASGDIILDDGGSLKEAGGTAALTFDGSGHITKIGQDSPSSSQVLAWDGSKAVWSATGSIRPDTVLHYTQHVFNKNSGTGLIYVPLNSTNDDGTLSEWHAWMAPHDGKLLKVMIYQ